MRAGGAAAAAAGTSTVLSAGLDVTVAVVKAVGKVCPMVPRGTHGEVTED